MQTLVVYESMYGNTHQVADAIAAGLRAAGEVRVVAVRDVADDLVAWADMVIVGGPTHAHGMTRHSTRQNAADRAAARDSALTLDPSAGDPGVREWLDRIGPVHGKRAAAFDTRVGGPALVTGAASGAIARKLRSRGFDVVVKPQSFLVDRSSRLVAGEADRATAWAADLVADLVPTR
jgi:Flavodoxin domain